MNRIIKFRAWIKEVETEIWKMEDVDEIRWDQWGSYSVRTKNRYWLAPLAGANAKLMQFTGLLDKNGKEIYEGDIVSLKAWDDSEEPYLGPTGIYTVKWGENGDDDKALFFETVQKGKIYQNIGNQYYLDRDYEIAEVIGNIYENSELLTNK